MDVRESCSRALEQGPLRELASFLTSLTDFTQPRGPTIMSFPVEFGPLWQSLDEWTVFVMEQ